MPVCGPKRCACLAPHFQTGHFLPVASMSDSLDSLTKELKKLTVQHDAHPARIVCVLDLPPLVPHDRVALIPLRVPFCAACHSVTACDRFIPLLTCHCIARALVYEHTTGSSVEGAAHRIGPGNHGSQRRTGGAVGASQATVTRCICRSSGRTTHSVG